MDSRITQALSCCTVAAMLILLPATQCSAATGSFSGSKQRFDSGWKFHRGDFADSAGGPLVTNWLWKPDSDTLPNDAAVDAAPNLDTSTGGWQSANYDDVFHGRVGFAWYRAVLPPITSRKTLLQFTNVDDNGTIYVNGILVGHHEGWDTRFKVDISRAVHANARNVVAVLVQNTGGGGGLNGPVSVVSRRVKVPMEAMPAYSDSAWRSVQLPQDFIVSTPFSPNANTSHGFHPVMVGWYRKNCTIPADARGREIWLNFEGIYRDAMIWINGKYVGDHPSGYTPYRPNITSYLHYGGSNVIAVRVDPTEFEGWWYEGGGIYRHVWLEERNALRVQHWGTYIISNVHNVTSANPSADLDIQTTVTNSSLKPATAHLVSRVINPHGVTTATVRVTIALMPHASRTVNNHVHLATADLWSLQHRNLYRLVSIVSRGATVTDEHFTTFGVRTISFNANTGFYLNGKPVKLKGTCNHQDFAGVGIGVPDYVFKYRVERLKQMGSNAYRCSHNPPASELLDQCDSQGMLVMDENRHLGDTYAAKSGPTTTAGNLADLKEMVLRDRNHPSIIMWSMCNEEPLQSSATGARIFAAMRNVTLALDPTRPVTCAMNGGWGQGISNVEDLQGCNYNPSSYDRFHAQFPNKPMYGSEVGSTVSTRGIYTNSRKLGYVSAYDVNAPSWAQTAEVTWAAIASRPFVAGGFVWTGFDYRGEPTPYGWPCVNSHFGILDMCGFAKDNYYYYKAWWGTKPLVHILPHWNWGGKDGQNISVWCYSACHKVELFLNGKSLGIQPMPKYGHVEWSVPYDPGTLVAKAYTGGKLLATDTVSTTGPAAAIRLVPLRKTIVADNEDVQLVKVEVVDSHGRVVPTAGNAVNFHVSGPAELDGVANGDPSDHESDRGSSRNAFNGLCMVIVRAGSHPGTITLSADSDGLASAHITFSSRARTP